MQDTHGLTISTSSAKAGVAFDRTLSSYLRFRADTADQLAATMEADAEFAMAHCLKGYLTMLSYKKANVPAAAAAARTARALTAHASVREQAHVTALDAWIAGDLERMLSTW